MKKNKIILSLATLLIFFSLFNVQVLFADDIKNVCKNEDKSDYFYERDTILGKQHLEDNIQGYSVAQKYTMADLNLLSDSDLIALIPTLEWYDITDLFQYNNDALEFYSNRTRMQALIDEVQARGAAFTNTDDLGIPTFIEIIRAGYFLGFYNSGLSHLDTMEEKNKCIPAITSIVNNPNFALGTDIQDEIIGSVGLFANASMVNTHIVYKFAQVVSNYVDNVNTFIHDRSKGTGVFNILNGVQHSINTYLYKSGLSAQDTEFYGQMNEFINEVMRIATIPTVTVDNAWLINNGIYYTGKLADFLTDRSLANKTLTEAMEIYPYLGEQYFTALERISYDFNGVNYYGEAIDYSRAIEDGKNHYLPKTYVFDDGTMVIKAGDEVAFEKIERLYWASKEVESQFFRLYGSDDALEIGNADDVLEMIIYNSPDEYVMNRYLYGLDTNNGGIYIEGDGRFFTYERTPQESIYSLEELFRHEYVHYLQGRYLVHGMWGTGPLYENERITWYEEGGAELFAGSTRIDGINRRQSMVGNISSNPDSRFTLTETLYARYGSFEFYTYGYAFLTYLYENDLSAFNRLAEYINTTDINNYDTYREELSSSQQLNYEFDTFMQELYDSYYDLTIPLVSDNYLLNHDIIGSQEVYDKIVQVSGLTNTITDIETSEFVNIFSLEGTYQGTRSEGYETDWMKMDTLIDGFLIELAREQWSGYKTLTAYFTNHRVDASGNFIFDVVFTGVSTWDETIVENIPPVANINGPYSGVESSSIEFSSNGSNDPDGNIASFLWSFGDGNVSTEENPTHIYDVAGTYEVSLTVTDNLGAEATAITTVIVEEKVSGPLDQEIENNDSVENANGPVISGLTVSGSFDENDSLDYYFIEVTTPSTININVNNFSNIRLNWLLYDANNTNDYISYPEVSENSAWGSYVAQPGRYYLSVYKTEGVASNYSLNVTVIPEELPSVQNESEKNDDFDTANPIMLDVPLVGDLNNNDYIDNFSFSITEATTLKIDLPLQSDAELNWVVFNRSNLNEYYSYADIVNGVLTKEFVVIPGEYFLRVYKISGTTAPYEVIINEIK